MCGAGGWVTPRCFGPGALTAQGHNAIMAASASSRAPRAAWRRVRRPSTVSKRAMQQMESVARTLPATRSTVPTQEPAVALSVVVPVFSEEESLRPLYDILSGELRRIGQTYEIVFVDDGSRDGTFTVLSALHEQDPHVKVIRFRRNFGKTPALVAGFKQ